MGFTNNCHQIIAISLLLSATAQVASSTCRRKKFLSNIFSNDNVYSLKCETKLWATSAFLAAADTWRCSAWAAVVLSVLHSTSFLKGVSFQMEFQQPQGVRQNPTGCLPALSLPSGWPRWTGVGAVEAEDMVPWSNPQVVDTAKRFLPPLSYSTPACDQSHKRLSQVNSSLLWLSLFHVRAVNHTYTASIYNKKKKYLQTVFKKQASITKSDLECSLWNSWFNWANLAIISRKKNVCA